MAEVTIYSDLESLLDLDFFFFIKFFVFFCILKFYFF